MSKYELYLNDILRAINLIDESTTGVSYESFKTNQTLIDATAMRLQIIGESLKKIPKKFKKNKEINWRDLQNLRNIISHAYFRINSSIIFSVVKDEIPKLKSEIQKIKENLS